MKVTKRNGTKQDLDLEKIHAVLEWACNGDPKMKLPAIKGTSVSHIEAQAHLQFYDGMTTKSIHETLIKTAESLISEYTPNYDRVAARLRWFAVRKEAFAQNNPPSLFEIVVTNTSRGIYDPDVIGMYTEKEWDIIDGFIDHNRDDLFRYAGAEQMTKKYLAQNRKTKQVYESFQIPYILVAAILFNKYKPEIRLGYVKRAYDLISQHYVSLPTPIMAGLRTKVKQFSSCTVLEAGDSLKSIKAAAGAIVDYASNKAGIGAGIGAIRAEGQLVRNGDAVTTGVLPFAKFLAAALKSCSQGAVRGASATFNWPSWHLEFDTLIELKNNKGTDEKRLRNVDYCVHMNKVLLERLISKGNITLFSPEEVPELYDAFYSSDIEKFREIYEKCEQSPVLTKKTLTASEFFSKIANERFGTGRIYPLFADLANTHTPFYQPIRLSNLCMEIFLPTQPMGEENEEIALCTLAAYNLGKLETEAQIAEAAEIMVRMLDELLDYQDYPNEAARKSTMKHRPLGVGVIGFAHWLVKNGLRWGNSSINEVNELFSHLNYYLVKASNELAKEKGPTLERNKYSDGILIMDTYKSEQFLAPIANQERLVALRENLKQYGIRNATLMALMPSETSSQLANETNGIEPPKELILTKGNKEVSAVQVVPEYSKYNQDYQLSFDVSVSDYMTTVGVMQKYICQGISANTYYDPTKGPIKTSQLIQDLFFAYKNGLKGLYYSITNDDEKDESATSEDSGCEGGACKI